MNRQRENLRKKNRNPDRRRNRDYYPRERKRRQRTTNYQQNVRYDYRNQSLQNIPMLRGMNWTQPYSTTATITPNMSQGAFILPIHPKNRILFKNLPSLYRQFGAYRMRDMRMVMSPNAPMTQGGSFVLGAMPPEVWETMGMQLAPHFGLPTFAFLANLGTKYIWPIAREGVYAIADNIKKRLKEYLMDEPT